MQPATTPAITLDDIASILRTRLTRTRGVGGRNSFKSFSAASGVCSATLTDIVDGKLARRPHGDTFRKLAAEVEKRGWLKPDAQPDAPTPSAPVVHADQEGKREATGTHYVSADLTTRQVLRLGQAISESSLTAEEKDQLITVLFPA